GADVFGHQVDLSALEGGVGQRALAEVELAVHGEALGLERLCVDLAYQYGLVEVGRADGDLWLAGRRAGTAAPSRRARAEQQREQRRPKGEHAETPHWVLLPDLEWDAPRRCAAIGGGVYQPFCDAPMSGIWRRLRARCEPFQRPQASAADSRTARDRSPGETARRSSAAKPSSVPMAMIATSSAPMNSCPSSCCAMPSMISRPSPPAPSTAASVAVATTCTDEMRSPARMEGSARGTSTSRSSCSSRIPIPRPASIASGSTWRSPA